ncbi:hypothetical protein PM082_004238 [Marasmius tenuissimus]|nr:hypothetical protein PM082_004238 [Marasmius tenuissimus]
MPSQLLSVIVQGSYARSDELPVLELGSVDVNGVEAKRGLQFGLFRSYGNTCPGMMRTQRLSMLDGSSNCFHIPTVVPMSESITLFYLNLPTFPHSVSRLGKKTKRSQSNPCRTTGLSRLQ